MRVRDAGFFVQQIKRKMASIQETLATDARADASALTELNALFVRDRLVGFGDGGTFAEPNLVKYKAQITDCDTVIRLQHETQADAISVMAENIVQEAESVLNDLTETSVVHKEDLKLIEKLDRSFQMTSTKTNYVLDGSRAHEASIASTLSELSHLLDIAEKAADADADADADPGQKKKLNKSAASKITTTTATTSASSLRGGRAEAQALLDTANKLSLLLRSRAKTLRMLKEGVDIPLAPHRGWVEGVGATPPVPDAAPRPLTPLGKKKPPPPKGKAATPPTPVGDPLADNPDTTWVKSLLSPEALDLNPADVNGEPVTSRVAALIASCEEICATESAAYYEIRDPKRPITRPQRISETLEGMKDINDAFLTDTRRKLEAHVRDARNVYRDQVISGMRALLRLPRGAFGHLTRHEAGGFQASANRGDAKFADILRSLRKELEKHKSSARPSLAAPSRRGEVDALVEAETVRSERALVTLKRRAKEAVRITGAASRESRARMLSLVKELLRIQDTMVLPSDLIVASGGGGDGGGGGGGDGDGAEEAGITGTETEEDAEAENLSPEMTTDGPPPTSTVTRMSLRQLRTLSVRQAEVGGSSEHDMPIPPHAGTGRGLALFQWSLEAENLRLAALGWTPEDAAIVHEDADDQTPVEAEGEQTKTTTDAADGSGTPNQEVVGVSPEAIAAAETEALAVMVMSGLDTPVHRAAIRAYRLAIAQFAATLQNAVATTKRRLAGATAEEESFRKNFNTMINQMGTRVAPPASETEGAAE